MTKTVKFNFVLLAFAARKQKLRLRENTLYEPNSESEF
jgi:hypothetical protein